jgi:hypothetical protein
MNALTQEIKDELLASLILFPYFQVREWKGFEILVLGGFLAVQMNLLIENGQQITTLGNIFPGAVYFCAFNL